MRNRVQLAAIMTVFMLVAAGWRCPTSAAEIRYKRTIENYTLPDVTLINQDGKRVRFKRLFETDKPVIVDFIFGTCTTICPVLSAGYANLQRKLGSETSKVHLVSLSIDPENDTPKVMREYLKRYQAKPGWDFYSGSRNDIDQVLRAFQSTFRDKMDHKPLTFILLPKEKKWVRIFGLISTSEFLEECRKAGVAL